MKIVECHHLKEKVLHIIIPKSSLKSWTTISKEDFTIIPFKCESSNPDLTHINITIIGATKLLINLNFHNTASLNSISANTLKEITHQIAPALIHYSRPPLIKEPHLITRRSTPPPSRPAGSMMSQGSQLANISESITIHKKGKGYVLQHQAWSHAYLWLGYELMVIGNKRDTILLSRKIPNSAFTWCRKLR